MNEREAVAQRLELWAEDNVSTGQIALLKEAARLLRDSAERGEVESALTDAMVDAPRMFLAYCETPGRNLRDARKHMENCGESMESWPEWAHLTDGHITKADMAIIVWNMMKAKESP